MYQANENLLKKWAKLSPSTDYMGRGVPVTFRWEWGDLVLIPGQSNGMFYYAYRRDAVQGKFAVVRLAHGYESWQVIGCEQTMRGAISTCAELNSLRMKMLDALSVRCDATNFARSVLKWEKWDDKMAKHGAGAIAEVDGESRLVDEAWDDAKTEMVDAANRMLEAYDA